jgi:predicted TIM-barrel fold metal-dependent hydrolase
VTLKLLPRPPKLPMFMRQLSSDEYTPPPQSALLRRAITRVRAEAPLIAPRLSMSLGDYWAGRQGRAAALLAIDEAWGGGFYNIPPEAALDEDAANAALGGDQLVIDVQTHYISDRPELIRFLEYMLAMCENVTPALFKGLDRLVRDQNKLGYSFAEYIRCIYLESETAVAVLSAGPGAEGLDPNRNLNNSEMVATKELIDRLGGTGRFINHCNVHPNVPGENDNLEKWREYCDPAGWKCYTMYSDHGGGIMQVDYPAWSLDDEEHGRPFLKNVMSRPQSRRVCVHKGISAGADPSWDGPSSPKDIGPAAKDFPGIQFLIYHSGYEVREVDKTEGPYTEETARVGVNRLITSLNEAGIGPGSNVYGELGSTWYQIMAHPQEASHVMGKLLKYLGEDNILWGTDCPFYGPPQPMIDAFRAFQIPDAIRDKHGYPQLTDTAKEKILGLNAARIYGMDPEKTKALARNDELAWARAAIQEYKAKGMPTTSTV